MSYDLKIDVLCDHRVIDEDKIIEDDQVTVILNRPLNNTSDITVKINDFVRNEDFMTEILYKENVTSQFSISNLDTIRVSQGSIYDGMKVGNLVTNKNDITVKIKVVEEDVSGQFTGTENFFFVQGKPILKDGEYDFVLASIEDLVIKTTRPVIGEVIIASAVGGETNFQLINSSLIGSYTIYKNTIPLIDIIDYTLNTSTGEIVLASPLVLGDNLTADYYYYFYPTITDIDEIFGRVQLKDNPILNDVTVITYNYRASIKSFDAKDGIVVLKQKPLISPQQEVRIAYFARINDGWYLQPSERSPIKTAKDIIFYSRKNTFRNLELKEDVTDQFFDQYGNPLNVNYFQTKNFPLLPLYQNFGVTSLQTLNNAITVFRYSVYNELFTAVGGETSLQLVYTPVAENSEVIGTLIKGIDYTIDYTTGLVTFAAPLIAGQMQIVYYYNEMKAPVMSIEPEVGLVAIYFKPQKGEAIRCTYYYQSELVPDRVSVNYSTDKTYCQKCAQHVYIWDYILDSYGDYQKVKDEYKLMQDLKKIIVTVRGSDHIATWYGTIFETIIAKKMDLGYTKTRIAGEITEALRRVKNAQIKQEEYQTLTDREFLDFIQSLVVNQDPYDPTYFKANVNIVTQAGAAFETQVPISG